MKCTSTWLVALINPVAEYGSPGLSSQKICKASSVISECLISLRMLEACAVCRLRVQIERGRIQVTWITRWLYGGVRIGCSTVDGDRRLKA